MFRHFVHLPNLSEAELQSFKILAFNTHQGTEVSLIDPVAITDNFFVIEAGTFTSFQVMCICLLIQQLLIIC